jgi:hypothetical protein
LHWCCQGFLIRQIPSCYTSLSWFHAILKNGFEVFKRLWKRPN